MTPLKSKAEVATAQRVCYDALEEAQEHTGMERMRLINKAFPYAFNAGEASGDLRICWSITHNSYIVSDLGGFLTEVTKEEQHLLAELIKLEAIKFGWVRYLITDKKPHEPPTRPRVEPKPKITLETLGLKP